MARGVVTKSRNFLLKSGVRFPILSLGVEKGWRNVFHECQKLGRILAKHSYLREHVKKSFLEVPFVESLNNYRKTCKISAKTDERRKTYEHLKLEIF